MLRFSFAICIFSLGIMSLAPLANAIELDWAGQFRAEVTNVRDYVMNSSDAGLVYNGTRDAADGYYVPAAGQNGADFQTLFFRLKPKATVNDNVYIKSELWLGNPTYGFYGNSAPYTADQGQFYSNSSRGASITAQRFWAEIYTDWGNLHIGRAPLHWGLGLVWNSGDGLWDHYQSTGDVIRMVSKFGNFTFAPSLINYSSGNTVGGACTGANCNASTAASGGGNVNEYSILIKYENPEEDIEGGVNFVKKLAGSAQGVLNGLRNVPTDMNFNTWDLYAKKKLSNFTIGVELPIVSGNIGSIDYSTFALASEIGWKVSDHWNFQLKAGKAPGAPDKIFYFNPNYKLGMLLFNYNFYNMGQLNTLNTGGSTEGSLKSPYDSSIVNAQYLNLKGAYQTEKWTFYSSWIYANASDPAVSGQPFVNVMKHKYVATANGDQGSSLGLEMDYGTLFQWDDHFQFGFDLGFLFPGNFYKFTNEAGTENPGNTVWASNFRFGINF